MSGAVQVTTSEVSGSLSGWVTVGASGAVGGSLTSVTLMLTLMVSSAEASGLPVVSLPSLTLTVTE